MGFLLAVFQLKTYFSPTKTSFINICEAGCIKEIADTTASIIVQMIWLHAESEEDRSKNWAVFSS